jgi:hypothetical protein
MVCPSVALTPESTIQRRFRTKVNCKLKRVQRREDHWAIVDLVGKGGHVRTIRVPEWVKGTIDEWLFAAGFGEGRMFRRVCRTGTIGAMK